MEHIIGLVFTAILAAGIWMSFDALMPLFARLPFPDWLLVSMNIAVGFWNTVIAILLVTDVLQYGLKRRKISQQGIALEAMVFWPITAAACGVACGAYTLLGPRHLPLWAEQLVAAAAGVGVFVLLAVLWIWGMRAQRIERLSANRR